MKIISLILIVSLFLLFSSNIVNALSFSDIRNWFGGITGRPIVVPTVCSDSDGGNKPLRYGTCSYANRKHNDVCSDKNTLIEYYCGRPFSSYFRLICTSKKYDCTKYCSRLKKDEGVWSGICVAGRCVCIPIPTTTITIPTTTTSPPTTTIPPEKCYDSDGGKNYYEKGTTSGLDEDGKYITVTDGCTYCTGALPEPETCLAVIENYCEGNEVKSEIYYCPNKCKDGACIKNETSLTKQDVLDMLNKCELRSIGAPSTNCNFICKKYTNSPICIGAYKKVISKTTMSRPSTQGEYTSKTYIFEGKTYKIEVVFISDSTEQVKLKINDEYTPLLKKGESYVLSDGVYISIIDITIDEGSEEPGADEILFNLYINRDDVYYKPVGCNYYENTLEELICMCCSPY